MTAAVLLRVEPLVQSNEDTDAASCTSAGEGAEAEWLIDRFLHSDSRPQNKKRRMVSHY